MWAVEQEGALRNDSSDGRRWGAQQEVALVVPRDGESLGLQVTNPFNIWFPARLQYGTDVPNTSMPYDQSRLKWGWGGGVLCGYGEVGLSPKILS